MTKIESNYEELQRQNVLLHKQIQTMSSKMADNLHRATSESPMNISLTEEGKSQDQILEILRYWMFIYLESYMTANCSASHLVCNLVCSKFFRHPYLFTIPGLCVGRRR